jgi:hypothetical protein
VEEWLDGLPAVLPEEEHPVQLEEADAAMDGLDDDDVSTILFPGLQPLAVPFVSSTTETPEPLQRLQVISDDAGVSSTQPGRALRWVDPDAPTTSAEAAQRSAALLAELPPADRLEDWEENLLWPLEEVADLLDPVEELANSLFVPGADWVEAPPTWRVTTPGRRVPDLLVEHIRTQHEEGVHRRVRFALNIDGATFRVTLGRGGRTIIDFHWHSKGGCEDSPESHIFLYNYYYYYLFYFY